MDKKEFNPVSGDIIVTKCGIKYVCVNRQQLIDILKIELKEDFSDELCIFGVDSIDNFYSWNYWIRQGSAEGAYTISEIVKNTDITMDKKYVTRTGLSVKVLTTTLKNDRPVLAVVTYMDGKESARTYMKNGMIFETLHNLDLVEYNPWDNVKIDTPIWTTSGIPYNFAKYDDVGDGIIYVFADGKNSHTASGETIALHRSMVLFENPKL